GMFEFRAFDENNNELQPNPESQINMQLTSRTSRPEYSMYLFNETSNAWEIKDDNRDELDVVKDLEARNKFSTAMASNRSRLSGLFQFQSKIAGNRLYTERLSTRVRRHRKSNGFEIEFKRYSTRNIKNLKRLSVVNALEKYVLVYDGNDVERDLFYLDSISCEMERTYRKLCRGTNSYVKRGPVFIGDIRLEAGTNANNKMLVIEYKDTILKYPVHPFVDDRSTDKMISFSTGFMKRYVREEKREAKKNLIAQKYIKRQANKIEAEMRAAGFDMTIEEYEAEMKRLKKECDEDLKTFRNMPLSRFG